MLGNTLGEGHGTGVLRAYYIVSFHRGLTVGVAGASSLYIAQRSGTPQNLLVAARGIGLVFSPVLLSNVIHKMVWSGNSQYGWGVAIIFKMIAELLIGRAESSLVLYAAFFTIGVTMAMLDTSATALVTKVHEKNCGLSMLLYCAVYAMGAMVAPFMTIANPYRAWDVLAAIDFATAMYLAAKRFAGKPRNWKSKIRKTGLNETNGGGSEPGSGNISRCTTEEPENGASQRKPSKLVAAVEKRPPARVLRAGFAFIFVAQAAETAMSCWAFTFAATTLNLPPKVCALFPTSFYLADTATRFAVVPLSSRLLPSAIAQVGTLISFAGGILFYCMSRSHADILASGELDPDQVNATVRWFLASFAMMGSGLCPCYAMMLGSLRQHGDLSARESSYYMTSYAAGITMGMWLPGVISLPYMELGGAVSIFLIMTSHVRDFPWRGSASLS